MSKRVLFIHQERKFKYGAHYINDLIIERLRCAGYDVDTIYPEESISLFSRSLSGIRNILFFYSLINKKRHANKYELVQGTTYTVLPFLNNGVPVVSHFGSTTYGFLKRVPSLKKLRKEKNELVSIFKKLKRTLGINNRSVSIRSLQDIYKIEIEVAKKSSAVIATSNKVRKELVRNGVSKSKIHLIYNAIEDYWFETKLTKKVKKEADLIYLGRMGDDAFTIKLKGINRLIYVLSKFRKSNKMVIGMCSRVKEYTQVFSQLPNTSCYLSEEKKKIPQILEDHYGDIYVNPGRYEGFCLSLVEAMSQGIVPVTFPIGVAPEIIENGKNGYLVKSIDEMVEKINLIKSDADSRKKMADSAVKTSRRFTPDGMITKLDRLYSKILKTSRKNTIK